ncbi:hypothetical protein, partial [Ameyamaea chiangmaiensis]
HERAAQARAHAEPPHEPVMPPEPPTGTLSEAETAWRARHRPEIEAIIRRHGSVARVFEKTAEEKALFDAVLPWHETIPDRDNPGAFSERWEGRSAFREPGPKVREALCNAVRLPRTIDDAISEVRRWIRLNHERSIVARWRDHGAPEWDFITGPVHMRAGIVREMAARTLPATTLAELTARVRFHLEHDLQGTLETEAILRDLHALQATVRPTGKAAKTPRGGGKNSAKRDSVARLLATPEGRAMTTRQIAERTGVSVSTVQAVKREQEQSALMV